MNNETVRVLLLTNNTGTLNEKIYFIKQLVNHDILIDISVNERDADENIPEDEEVNIIGRANSELYDTATSLYDKNKYKMICVDAPQDFTEYNIEKLHDLWSKVDALILVLPRHISGMTDIMKPETLILPVDYQLLPPKNIEQLNWLTAHAGIKIDLLHVNDNEERMESLYDDTDKIFAADIKNKLNNTKMEFHFIRDKNDDAIGGIKEYIRKKHNYLFAITRYNKSFFRNLFETHTSSKMEENVTVPYFVFNYD